MDAIVAETGPAGHNEIHDVAVAVITPVGTYPDNDDYRRVPGTTVVATVLDEAAKHLKITNTTDWVTHVDGHHHHLEVGRSFKDNHLHGIVEIEWHKREGGGGA